MHYENIDSPAASFCGQTNVVAVRKALRKW